MAIRRCLPEHMLIAARARTPCLVNAPMCIVAFTAVSYKRPCCKCRPECVRTRFRTRLSGEALTSMPHFLRGVNLFVFDFFSNSNTLFSATGLGVECTLLGRVAVEEVNCHVKCWCSR